MIIGSHLPLNSTLIEEQLNESELCTTSAILQGDGGTLSLFIFLLYLLIN